MRSTSLLVMNFNKACNRLCSTVRRVGRTNGGITLTRFIRLGPLPRGATRILGGCGGMIITRRGLNRFTKCLHVGISKFIPCRFGRMGNRPFMIDRLISTFARVLGGWWPWEGWEL